MRKATIIVETVFNCNDSSLAQYAKSDDYSWGGLQLQWFQPHWVMAKASLIIAELPKRGRGQQKREPVAMPHYQENDTWTRPKACPGGARRSKGTNVSSNGTPPIPMNPLYKTSAGSWTDYKRHLRRHQRARVFVCIASVWVNRMDLHWFPLMSCSLLDVHWFHWISCDFNWFI